MGHSIAAWTNALQQQMPRGLAWPTDVSGRLYKYVSGYAPRLQRVEEKAAGLLSEMRPETMIETLEEWEVYLGLPECFVQYQTFEERRNAVIEKYHRKGGLQAWNIEELAAKLGFDISVDEVYPHHCLRDCTYPLYEESLRNVIQITVYGITQTYSSCLDDVLTPIASSNNAAILECTLNKFKMAGKYYNFIYPQEEA